MTKYGVIYDAHTRREFGSVEIMRCLWILLLLKNISVVCICGWREWGGGGVTKLAIFCGRHKCMAHTSLATQD